MTIDQILQALEAVDFTAIELLQLIDKAAELASTKLNNTASNEPGED
jgi:hypothetical protein